jgi:RNA polymerase sigma factor (sigma-70 family)
MDDMRPDEALMLAYRDGEAGAFDILYSRNRGKLFRYLARQVPHCADELFQDIWMRVIGARDGYTVSAKFSTWLFRIAHNRLMDHFRAQGRSIIEFAEPQGDDDDCPALDPPASASAQPDAMLARKALAQQILAALDELPAAQRETFLLAEEGGLSLEEIAVATGVGKETAKSRLRYALERLRRTLEDAA